MKGKRSSGSAIGTVGHTGRKVEPPANVMPELQGVVNME